MFLLIFVMFIYSCGVTKTKNLLNEGDYDAAIDNAIEGLRSNKFAKGKQDYVFLLEDAFVKAKERDLRNIDLLTKDGNPNKFNEIYNTYLLLNNRQDKIRPLLPLPLLKKGQNAFFPFDDYNQQIVSSKNILSKYLYDNSKALLLTNDKLKSRNAYDDLKYLDQINPNYKDANNLIGDALFKGTDYVMVYTKNETNMVIPNRLLNDLMNFSTYGLNDKWTVFHSIKSKGISYDYEMILSFRDIQISPEQIKEREFIKERQIKDGQKKLLNENGKVVIDKNGKEVMVDNMIKATVKIFEIRQLKSCLITAKVDFLNTKSKQLLNSFPISSEFIFENIYSNFKGDRRAAEDNYMNYFNNKVVPFPNTEQMIYDTGEDLKQKLKNIILKNKFN